MNARIVNLRTRRKQKARKEKRERADLQTREASVDMSERDTARRNEALRLAQLDNHRADDDN